MGLNLRKIRDAAFAQINPFDGGKTANTVWNNTPVGYKDQAQTIRPTGLASRNGTIYIDQQARQVSQARPQQSFIPGNQQKPSGFMGALNDAFDANTANDIAKRNQAELAKAQMAKENGRVYAPKLNQTYTQQQTALGNRSYTNPIQSIAYGLAKDPAKGINSLAGAYAKGLEGTAGLTAIAASKLVNTSDEFQNNLQQEVGNRMNAPIAFSNKGGLLGQGTNFKTAQELDNKKKFASSMVKTGVDVGSVIPVGGGAAQGTGIIAKQGAKQLIGNSLLNAGLSGTQSIATQVNENRPIDLKEAGLSTLAGGALPVVAFGAGRLLKGASNEVGKKLKMNQTGAIPLDPKNNPLGKGAPIEKTPQVGKIDPMASLKQEAKGFKTADEFVDYAMSKRSYDPANAKIGDNIRIDTVGQNGTTTVQGKIVDINTSVNMVDGAVTDPGLHKNTFIKIEQPDGSIVEMPAQKIPGKRMYSNADYAYSPKELADIHAQSTTPQATSGAPIEKTPKTPQQIKQSLNEGFLDIDTSNREAVKSVFDNAGYVDNGGFKVHPNVDQRWVDDLSPETKQLMADEGITYIDPSPDQDVWAMAVQKNLGNNKVKGISVNSKKDAGLFTNKDSIVAHEIGHHKWNQLTPAEKAEWANRPAQSEFGKRIEAGHQHSGAMKGEEEFAEQYARSKTGTYGSGDKPLRVQGAPIEKTPDVLMQEAKDIEATMGSGYLGTLPPSIAQRKMREFNKRLADINKQLNGNEPKLNGIERKITGTEPKLNQVEPKSTETVYKITARNQAGVIKQLRELSKKADSDGNTTLGDKLYKLADDVMYDRQYEYFGNKGYKHKLDKLVKTYAQAKSGAPIEKTPATLDDVFNDPDNIGLFEPPQKQANAFQDTLPSKSRPNSVKAVVDGGGTPLYHDTDAKGIMGILDSGTINPSQAPFSQIAGQGKRVSTTRNFDNYSRYHDSPYRLVIDESRTGQKSIPDNREEFESIFNKPVSTKAVQGVAVDITNPVLIKDIQNGTFAKVVEKAKQKGITIEPFEGKILPKDAANAEIQKLTKELYAQSGAPIEKTPTRAQAMNKVAVAASEAPKLKTPNDLLPNGVDETLAKIDAQNKLMFAKSEATGATPKPKVKSAPKPVVKAAQPTKPNVVKSSTPELSFTERQALAQANKESQILKPRGVESIRAKGRDVSSKLYNPYSEAERLNHRNAKAQNLSVIGSTKKLDATQDLASKMDFVANSRVAAKQLMEDTGLDKVVQKYPDKKGKVNEFVLYLAAKRDVAVSGAKGKRIYGGETLDDVNKFVADFEARNPQAKSDLEAVKGSFRKLLDDELKSGNITPEFHRNAIATEDYYAPIERVLGSEDVLRPSVNVNNKASLSRSSATKKLEGSADPIKGDWDAIIGGMQRRVRETKLNQAYGVMYDIAKNKRVDDAVKLGMSKEQSQAFIGLQDTIASLQKQAQTANKTVKTASKKARVESKKMTAYTNKVNDKAIERIAKNLEVNDVDGAATIRGLKRSDKNQLMDWLQGNMTDAEITNGIKKSSQLQDAMARLQEARAIADDLKTEGVLFKGAKSELVKATDARGRQVIRGFVDGYPTWLEVTPEIAKMVQGLEPQKLPGLIKGLSSIQRVWRTFWTGAYNPVFAAKSFLLYDPPMGAINQSGSRFQLDPRVLGKAIADIFTDYDGFFKELKRTGVQPVYGSKMSGDIKLDAKVIASHKNFQKRIGYLATHPGQLLEALDVIGGKLAHSTRMRTARAELARSLSKGLSKKVATENAARAYNNILPNYGRTTRLMKEIDAIIPYASAGVAGNRALTTAMRTDPAGWATKVGLFATAIAATGEYALTSDETKAFYQDMYDSKKVSVLQNNIVFALPGAKKDPKTGEWSGIVKIALPPEFRAPNAVLQQSLADNNGIDTGEYKPGLAAVTSLATAGITNIGRTGGVNAEYNPAIQAVLELSTNRQGGAGDSFTYGDNKFLPRNEQINKDTSQLAVSAAQAYNKLPFGDVSPTALDAQFKGLGMGGNVIRSVGSKLTADASTPADRLPGTGLGKTVKGLYSADGTKGMTDTSWHFKNQEAVKNELPTEGLRNQFDALNSKNDSPGDAGAKAGLLYESVQTDGALWNAQKKQNDLDAARTGISNPLFDLSPEQARAVTLYRSNARMNAAKQTYAKDGSSLFQSLGLDEKWYQDFKTQESAFYDKIKDKTKGDSQAESVATGAKTYSGNPYKEPSMVIQSKLDKYYTLPKGTGARTAFLKDNPDVIQYWDEQNGLANEERIAMGLDLLDSDSNDSGYGSKGYSKYGYSRGGGSGGGGSGDGLASEYDNPYKYAVSIKAKGSSKATVKLGGKIAKRGVTAKATSKPKVTIKKSTA